MNAAVVPGDHRAAIGRILLSLVVSAALVALLWRAATGSGAASAGGDLARILGSIDVPFAGAYLLAQILLVLLRAERYRLLLRGNGEATVPGRLPMSLVTASRNMFVDLLPARIGELSYVALLNRRYGVAVRSCLSSLGVAVFLDFAALLVVLAALLGVSTSGSAALGGLRGSAALLGALVAALAWAIFSGLGRAARLAARLPPSLAGRRPVRAAADFLTAMAADVAAIRASGVLPRSLALSLALRVCKYTGLYAAFLAVTGPSLGQLARAPAREVVAALIAGEGTASLPVPSFMSFGTYESGGVAAFAAFGYPAAQTVLALLALHLLSQLIDYGLGALGLLGVAVIGRNGARPALSRGARRSAIALLALATLAAAALGGRVWQQREQERRGLATPPPPGVAAVPDGDLPGRLARLLGGRRGFVVWSSNRFGTHDILRMDLPDGTISRLTADPHAEAFPRIAPDGRRVVFSRSQAPWVSQRDPVPWDAWVLDPGAARERERLAARGANGPFWSGDGGTVFFQRNGGEFVSHRLDTGAERTLFRAGAPPVPAGAVIGNPDYDEATGRLVATLRGAGVPRITALFTAAGPLQRLGGAGDCQVSWSPDRSFLYFVGHGGRQQNALYRQVPGKRPELWLDLPGGLSHEYFPRLSADGRFLVFAASAGGAQHEHDAGDYELFLWRVGDPAEDAVRLTFHTGNDSWPDLYLAPE